MRHLDLFSGIGGFALAARRVGWETIGFCEIDEYCQKVLAKHWPGVPIYDDIEKLSYAEGVLWQEIVGDESNGYVPSDERLPGEGHFIGPVDIITGGFPCQDISYAGKGAGIEGERSGLWTELARLIGDIRPRYAVLENVAALLNRGLDRVAGDLAQIGYDAEWYCIPASAVGAPHRRDRAWIIAYPNGDRLRNEHQHETEQPELAQPADDGAQERMADTDRRGREGERQQKHREQQRPSRGEPDRRDPRRRRDREMGNADQPRLERWLGESLRECTGERAAWQAGALPDTGCRSGEGPGSEIVGGSLASWWFSEPAVGRVAHGIPRRVDRLRALGNAIVPQVAEVIFRAINESL